MAIQDDFTVSQSKDIRYVGAAHGAAGAGYYTVIQFHRWLQSLADDAVASAASLDFLDITDNTPSERQTDNIVQLINSYNIDQTASEHLFDGTIIQSNGDEIWDGLVVLGGQGMDLQIIQDGARIATDFWNTVPNGSSFKGLNSDSNNGITTRFMLKVRSAGADIDGRRLLGQTRVWGFSFSEFKINGTSRGNNVMALTYAADLNNAKSEGTVGGYTGITLTTTGYNAIDVDANGTPEYYYSKWNANKPTNSINDFYERCKYIQRRGTAETIFGLSGELFRGITHQFNYDTEVNGPFVQAQPVTWTGGSGQLLALLDSGVTGTMWIQLLTGTAPVDNTQINQTGGKTCLVNGTVTERTLSFPFCGQSTGSAIIGGYGVGLETDDLTSNDKVFDLTNTPITPPNNQIFYVNGLVNGEDYVVVGPYDAVTGIDYNQFTLQTALSADNITAVVVNTAIPADTPTTGTIRVADNNDVYRRLVYTSWTGSTFTIDPTASEVTVAGVADFASVNADIGNDVWISYVDKLATASSASYQATYLADRALFVRVRDGGGSPIKTFESQASFGSGGGTSTVIRTSDA